MFPCGHLVINNKKRAIHKLLLIWLRDVQTDFHVQTDVQNGVIRVQAPELTKSSCLIQLDDQITAGDIVAKFRRDYGSGPSTVEWV